MTAPRSGIGAGALAAWAALIAACGPERPPPGACSVVGEPAPVAEALSNDDDPCRGWVARVYGRVLRTFSEQGGRGSSVLWSTDTDAGSGVLVTAAHVMTPCIPMLADADAGSVCRAGAVDPGTAEADVAERLAEPGTGIPRSEWSPAFPMVFPELRPGEPWDAPLPPARDFSVYAIDDQLLPAFSDQPRPQAEPLGSSPPPVDDPADLLSGPDGWAPAVPGGVVLLVGYPERTPSPLGSDGRRMEYGVGIVSTDDEARAALADLAAAGDEEGAIPYDPEVEMLVRGTALPGMSGGGVFDERGALVGIMVRASTAPDVPRVVRAVRTTYVAERVAAIVGGLDPSLRDAVSRRLPPLRVP